MALFVETYFLRVLGSFLLLGANVSPGTEYKSSPAKQVDWEHCAGLEHGRTFNFFNSMLYTWLLNIFFK